MNPTYTPTLVEDRPQRWSRAKAWAVWIVVGAFTWVGLAALLYWVVK